MSRDTSKYNMILSMMFESIPAGNNRRPIEKKKERKKNIRSAVHHNEFIVRGITKISFYE